MSELRTNRIVPRDGLTSGTGIGGGIIQVKQTFKTDITSGSGSQGSFQDISGLSVSITPKFSTSTTRITVNIRWGSDTSATHGMKLLRDSTSVYSNTDVLHNIAYNINTNRPTEDGMYSFFDTPGTTSQVTYKFQIRSTGGTFSFNGRGGELNSPMDSYMIVEEIAA